MIAVLGIWCEGRSPLNQQFIITGSLQRPIFDRKSRNLTKVSLIASDNGSTDGQGNGGNPHIFLQAIFPQRWVIF
jgi:hypothetical protein